jgi:hypothetical protein
MLPIAQKRNRHRIKNQFFNNYRQVNNLKSADSTNKFPKQQESSVGNPHRKSC